MGRHAMDAADAFRLVARDCARTGGYAEAKAVLYRMCEDLPSAHAAGLLIDVYRSYTHPVDWLPASAHGALFDVGDLMLRLEDAACLSPASRRVRWLEESTRRRSEREQHCRAAMSAETARRMHATVRDVNEKVYERLRTRRFRDVRGVDAASILKASDAQLKVLTPSQWYALRFEVHKEDTQRALLHRLRIFMDDCGATHVPPTTREAMRLANARLGADREARRRRCVVM